MVWKLYTSTRSLRVGDELQQLHRHVELRVVPEHGNLFQWNVRRPQRRLLHRLGLVWKLLHRRSLFVELHLWGLHGRSQLRFLLGLVRVPHGKLGGPERELVLRLVVAELRVLARGA